MSNSNKITELHNQLKSHPIYKEISTLDNIRVFMKWHVFAVWDFMSLLKGLQREITCVSVPWRPSPYPKDLARFINEIVLGEESDEDGKGGYTDHFTMYLDAMDDINADQYPLRNFLETMDYEALPEAIREFVKFNIELSSSNDHHKIAAAFFYGRENLIPDIFGPLVAELKSNQLDCPNLIYYLERHIELDGDEHGDLAGKCFDLLCGDSERKRQEGIDTAITSLKLRDNMWSYILGQLAG